MEPQEANELRVLVAAPTRRDGEATRDLLSRAGVHCEVIQGLVALSEQVDFGVGALILTDAALNDPGLSRLAASMLQQPQWSDVPTVLLTRDKVDSASAVKAMEGFRNITLLDRPSSTRSMVSAVKSALRARQRQYQIRDQLVAQQAAEGALRDADQRKDEFLATLAHELRNPLAAIRAGLELLIRKPEERERGQRVIGMLDRQSRLLVKLIDDLMDVSRVATGKVALHVTRLDLRAVVEAGLESARTVFDASRHEVVVALPAEPVWVNVDGPRLTQVVGNVLNNAGKYTPEGGRVAISVEEQGDSAVVRVVDSGVGIPAELLEQVFEMFAQVERTMSRAQGGLGIGLSLVRRLVQLHGGTVTAHSDGIGRGSTFEIRLPRAVDEIDEATSDAPADERSAVRRLRVLVVDDNRDVADALGSLLEAEGHETRIAYDGATALVEADAFAPDAIFCDIGMPVMGGHEVAARLRSVPSHHSTLLVALTGWGTESDRRLSSEAGFDAHFTKPINFEQMRSVLAPLAGTAAH